MSGLNDKPIVVNLNMDKETTDYIAKHDYIKVGDKEYISRDRAKLLVGKLANGADNRAEVALHKQNVSLVEHSGTAVCENCIHPDTPTESECNVCKVFNSHIIKQTES